MIKCTLENEGFIANYYEGNYEPNKAIIVVGGASCNKKTTTLRNVTKQELTALCGYLNL